MNWGHRLKEIVTRNWREKIISFVLAFLFWFMIKAQDVRQTPAYLPPQPMKMSPQTIPAPSQLEPTLEPSTQVSPQLNPVVSPSASGTVPVTEPGVGIGKSTGL
jgi:hypothetical protein